MCRKLILLASVVLAVGLGGRASAELVARYSFDDGTASDSAYYYEDAEGTFFGDAEVVDDPCRGAVLDLDGSGDYVKVLNSEVANFSTESFTFSFWAQCSAVSTWYYFWRGTVFEGLKGVNCFHDIDSGEVRFTLYNFPDPGKVRVNVPDANFVTGKWIHIACMRDADADELRLYVNGELEPPAAGSSNPQEDTVKNISNTGQLYIGCDDRGDPGPTAFFYGRIDDFRVYNNALSQQDVQKLSADYQDPNLASNPSPRDGGHDVCPGASLSWTGGDNVVDHNVYFGTSLSDVNSSATAYIAHHLSTSFSPTLEYDTTYYWRIDEVGASDVWKGYIWKFTTNDGNAFDPYPADGQSQVSLNPTLYWTPGCLAASHDFYFGTDYNEVNAADGSSEPNVYYEDRGAVNSYDACTPDYSTYYYWRVDEVNGLTEWRGQVLTFKSEGAIFDPNLRVWYKLDETEGTIAGDSSGREYDGDLDGNSVWDANGYNDGCLNLDDNGSIIVPMGVLGEIDKEITIAVWLNTGTEGDDDNVVCAAGAVWEPNYLRVAVPDDDHDVSWRAGNETNDVMTWDGGSPKAWKGSWNHFAFVKDENAGKMQIYLNGLRVAEQTSTSPGTLAGLRNRMFSIGGGYIGKIDDYQLYDRALTAKEIEAIFRGGDLASAWGQSPYDGEDEVPYDVVLRWRPGDYAADTNAHEVYFGTSWDDVNDANNLLPVGTSVYKGPQDLDSNSYDPPGLLDLEQTYYWRIDEVNDANNDRWKGRIWKFTVAEYITIDDFEKYDVGYADDQDGSWESTPETGSAIEFGDSGWGPVRGGKMSMIYWYDNTYDWGPGYYSEASTEALSPTDWNDFDIKLLTLWFYGDPDNDATYLEQMYVGVKDSNGCYAELRYGDNEGEDMNDIKIAAWQRWDIPLTCFSDSNFAAVPNDVNLADVEKLYIGFGIRGGDEEGGEGTVYFDDIRLYPPTCRPEKIKPAADLNNDCTVDFADVEIMADAWLETDVNLGQVKEPCDANLLGWWKLDDGEGSVAADSSTYGHNGVIQFIDVNVWWVAGRPLPNGTPDGNALEFNGGRVRVPDAPELRPLDQVGACAWIYYSEEQNSARVVVKGADNKETYDLEVSDDDALVFLVRDGNDYDEEEDEYEKYAAESNDATLDRDEWIHVAGTYDGNVVKCYINGEVAAEDVNGFLITYLSQDTNDLAIGNQCDDDDSGFKGTIDFVLVYDYGLSAEEIAYIATDGTGIFTVQSVANLYNDEDLGKRAVNLRDFAKLAKGWLEKKLWPE